MRDFFIKFFIFFLFAVNNNRTRTRCRRAARRYESNWKLQSIEPFDMNGKHNALRTYNYRSYHRSNLKNVVLFFTLGRYGGFSPLTCCARENVTVRVSMRGLDEFGNRLDSTPGRICLRVVKYRLKYYRIRLHCFETTGAYPNRGLLMANSVSCGYIYFFFFLWWAVWFGFL